MIMGIISLIFFIVGLVLYMYKFRNQSDIREALGLIMFIAGLIGTILFLIVNANTIISWFTI